MNNEQPSYWNSVIVGALFSAIVIFAVSLISGYMTIKAEPTGSVFSPSQMIGVVSCLIGALGGWIATRHYATTYNVAFPIGKGAVIGLLAGIVAGIISALLSQIWTYIDAGYVQGIIDSTIANLDASSMIPDDMKEEIIMETEKKLENQFSSFSGIMVGSAISAATFGILNLLSGMVGAKMYGSEE